MTHKIEKERLDIHYIAVCPSSWNEIRKDFNHFKIHTSEDYAWATPAPPKIYRNIIITLVMLNPRHRGGILSYVKKLKDSGHTERVYFDSGGFQVMTKKLHLSFEDMLRLDERLYNEFPWADGYVMPDTPPNAAEPLSDMIEKVKFTIKSTCEFFDRLPKHIQKKCMPVFHLRFPEQIDWQYNAYKHIIEESNFACISLQAPSEGSLNRMDFRNMTIMKGVMDKLPKGVKVHCLGIASPASVFCMGYVGVNSFDAVTPITNAGMGRVLFHTGGVNFTNGRPGVSVKAEDVIRAKEKSNHSCPFCDDLDMLYSHYRHRRIHNHIMLDEVNHYYRELDLNQFSREWPKESGYLEQVIGNGQQALF